MDWILDFEPSTRFPTYTRGNISEVFPDPITPLNATTGFLQNFEKGYRDAFVSAEVWDPSIYDGEVRFALLGCLGGYAYINMSYLRVFAVRVPGYTPDLLDLSYGVDSQVAPYENECQPWHEDAERSKRVQHWIDQEVFGATDLPVFDRERTEVLAERAARPDLTTLSATELVERIRSFNPLLRKLFQSHAEASLKAGFALGMVVTAAEQAGNSELAFEVVSGVGDVDSIGPTVLMADLARLVRESPALSAVFDAGVEGSLERIAALGPEGRPFLDSFSEVTGEWGFRGPGEWELRRDTWETKPELALGFIDRMRRPGGEHDPQQRMNAASLSREKACRTLAESLESQARESLETGARAAGLWVRARERSRTTSAMLLHEQRVAVHELGRVAVAAGTLTEPTQICMLLADELDDWLDDPTAWSDELASREQTYLSLFDYEPPFMVTGAVPDKETWARHSKRAAVEAPAAAVLTGAPGGPGQATGRARIVRSATEVDELEPGEILVARITDPSWTPLFLTSSAVVTEVGGIFSHGPIVCRELGTPCVVALDNACQLINDGTQIQVDGTAGTVTIFEG